MVAVYVYGDVDADIVVDVWVLELIFEYLSIWRRYGEALLVNWT